MIFVDTNILIDVTAPDQSWRAWSNAQLLVLGRTQRMVCNHVVVAELATGFPALAELLEWLEALGLEILPLDDGIAFYSGFAFRSYRRRHRDRSAILSDFLIGGHAQSIGATLLTRDSAIYRTYFPDLTLITPETDA